MKTIETALTQAVYTNQLEVKDMAYRHSMKLSHLDNCTPWTSTNHCLKLHPYVKVSAILTSSYIYISSH